MYPCVIYLCNQPECACASVTRPSRLQLLVLLSMPDVGNPTCQSMCPASFSCMLYILISRCQYLLVQQQPALKAGLQYDADDAHEDVSKNAEKDAQVAQVRIIL